MNKPIEEILAACDHTLLRPDATWDEIKVLCDEAVRYNTASVCIPPCYVKRAKDYLGFKKKICTVVGFPNGTSTTPVKVFETENAIEFGADEIDMVINIGKLKAHEYDRVMAEIKAVKSVCGSHILKVIIETCLLSEEEKAIMCGIVTEVGADYIKTSTGFSTGGATFYDIALFKEHLGPNVKIKAAGGITTLEDAETFLELGADRLGTSRIVKLVKEAEKGAKG